MKNYLFKTCLLTGIILFSLQHYAGTVHSTTFGGNWNDQSTWIEGYIPGTNDTAIILGPVIVGHVINPYEIVHSYGGWVIVEQDGSLQPHEYGGGLGTFILFVAHDFTNRGYLSNFAGQDNFEYLQLNINGDIYNEGIWHPYKTVLTGTEQHISQSEESTFGGYWECASQQNIYAISNFRFDGLYWTDIWNRGDFNLNNAVLHINDHSIDATATLVYNGTIEGDFEIKGRFSVNKSPSDTLKFMGTITVVDTLENSVYGGGLGIQNLLIEGDLINNGVIRDDQDAKNDDRLSILIKGDITNNGEWSCYHVKFTGSEEQHITQAEGRFFDSFFEDLNGASPISAETDITITNDFELGGTTLNMGNGLLTVGGWLKNGNIQDCLLKNACIQNLTSLDNLEIYGKVTCDDGNVFLNHVRIIDTLQSNEYGGGSRFYDLHVNGYFINDGVIQNNNIGDRLRLHISKDIVNEGIWEHAETILTGNEGQELTQDAGSTFGGNFINLANANTLSTTTDLAFSGNFNLGGANFSLDGKKLGMEGWLYNGVLDHAELHGGFLQQLDCMNGIEMYDRVTIDDSVSFEGPVTIHDTLIPNVYGGGAKHYHLNMNGNVTNHGVIMDNYWGESLFLYISGNITNNGEWVNYLTHVYVSDEQFIELLDDKPIESAVSFEMVIGVDPFQWYYENELLDSPDFEGETSKILSWNVPVSSAWYGNFHCESGNRETAGILLKKAYTDINESQLCKAKIWSYDKYVCIDLQEEKHGEALVYDLLGRKVGQFDIYPGQTKYYLDLTGFFVIRVRVDQKVADKKICLR